MPNPELAAGVPKSVDDAICLACGCLCDDVRLSVRANRVVGVDGACLLGERWFLAERPPSVPACRIDGGPASFEAGLERAANILAAARHVLVFGLAGATCEAQRAAVSLADGLGGRTDVGDGATTTLTTAFQAVGMATATLGEVRHRADFVMFWGVDPATTHPRHFERYSLTCAGEFVPRGRVDRFCTVVDSRRTPTADAADAFYEILPGGELAALDALRALIADGGELDGAQIAQQTGVEPARWRELMERMQAARYGAIFFQPASSTQALLTLARDMNRHSRFVALPLGSAGNSSGARQVLTWQSGYPSGVDFAAGYPQYDVDEYSADRTLSAGQADAALVAACDPLADPLASLSEPARTHLAAIPTVILHTADWEQGANPAVAITVAAPGIEAGGTVFRCDGVALPLRPAVDSPYPRAEAVLLAIEERIRQSPAAR